MNDDLQKFLDELRSRIAITDVVGSKVKLTKKGREYLGLCPFHNEKTPSFTVNENKGFYHCFGCGAHGDIIRFEMDANGLPFIEAVKKLAGKVGLELPALSKENQEHAIKRKSLYEVMDIACSFFEKNLRLPIGAKALDYFKNKRGLSEDIIKKFRLGFAPNNNGLKALLISKGISEQDMADLGLITIPEDNNRTSRDFFRDRVMIPIMDKQGNVIAFGGRILDNSQPKYLNSPETPIFNKRRILYNMTYAKDASYASKRLVICEGYMDVIALDSFNFNYAVAPLGTSLTEEQILEAWKVCNIPTLCFDGDGAGIKAAIRSIDRVLPILKAGYSVNYVFLKDKKDPDEILHSLGPQAFEQYLQRAKPLVDILWHKCKMNKDTDTPEQKALIEKETFEEVNKIKDEKIRNYYMQEMKQRIYYTFGKGAIYKNANDKKNTKEQNINSANLQKNKDLTTKKQFNFVEKPPLDDYLIRSIIAGMLLYPELIKKYEDKITAFELSKTQSSKVLFEIIDIHQNDDVNDSEILIEKIKLNYDDFIKELWELNMYKSQKTSMVDLKEEIDKGLLGIQLKQIDIDIRNCINSMNKQTDDYEDIYHRYQQLIRERNRMISDTE
jgi:DNA primase